MLAVIKAGGKQYKVEPGKKIKIDKIEEEQGKEVIFDQVLLVEKDKNVEIGNPLVKTAKVIGTVLKQDRGKKVIIYKYKSKKRQHKKQGFRPFFTEVEIQKIEI